MFLGEGCPGGECLMGNIRKDRRVRVRIPMQDYKSQRVAAMISTTEVNTQTHTHTEREPGSS